MEIINLSLGKELKKPNSLMPPAAHKVSYKTFSRKRFSSFLAQRERPKRPPKSLPPLNFDQKIALNSTIETIAAESSLIPKSIRNQPENSIIPPIKDLIVHPKANRFYFSRSNMPSRAYIRQRAQEHLAKKYPKYLHLSADPNLSDEIEYLNRPMMNRSRQRLKNENFADKIQTLLESPRLNPSVVYSIEDFELKKGLNGSYLVHKDLSLKDEIPFSKKTSRPKLNLSPNNKILPNSLPESKNLSPRHSIRNHLRNEIRRISKESAFTRVSSPRRHGSNAGQLESQLIPAYLNNSSRRHQQQPTKKFKAKLEPLNLKTLEIHSLTPRKEPESTELSKTNSKSALSKPAASFNLSKIGSRKNSDFRNQMFYFPSELTSTNRSIDSSLRFTKRSPSRIPSNQSLSQSFKRETEEQQPVTETVEQIYPPVRTQKHDAHFLLPLNRVFGQRNLL